MSADRATGRGVGRHVGFDAPSALWPSRPSSVPERGEARRGRPPRIAAARPCSQVTYPSLDGTDDRDVPDPPRRRRARARHPDDPQRLRRVRHRRDAGVVADDRRVVRAGRAVRDRRAARRDRARRGVAPRRAPGEQAERVRRLPRRRRLAGGDRAHVDASGWRSSVGRTAGSSSAPRSRSGPICAARCGAACRCST